MKTNNTKKNSATKKLIPAVSMLTVSAMMLSTATYAWFTMNKEVTVTGMQMSTTVTSNLLIAAANVEADFTTSLNQSVTGVLEPVSTINGVNFYYTATNNVLGNGDAIQETYTAYNPSDTSAFNTNYGTTGAVGYIDYAFYLKADNANASDAKEIRLTDMNLLLNDAAVGSANAWTSAIFVHEVNAGASYSAFASSDVITIDKMSGASNFEANKAIGEGTSGGELKTLSYGATPATAYGTTGVIATVGGGQTKYYAVDVRLWLEGEDTSCTTTIYKNNLSNYKLDLKFCFDDSDAAITTISSTPATP